MKYDIQLIFPTDSEHGEGPVWDGVSQQLYWVDLLQGVYHRGNPVSGAVHSFSVGQPLGVMALTDDERLIMALHHGFAFWDEKTASLIPITDPEADQPETRFNDGAVDPQGRFLAGTMTFEGEKPVGKLYRLGADLKPMVLEDHLFIPNGMGWCVQSGFFFFTDTNRNVIYQYIYAEEDLPLQDKKVFHQFARDEFPDGLTIDRDGCLWVAMWAGGKITRLDPYGKKIEDILLPVSHPTSCCLGGEHLDQLYITTSRRDLRPDQKAAQPWAGKVIGFEPGVTGLPEPRVKVRDSQKAG